MELQKSQKDFLELNLPIEARRWQLVEAGCRPLPLLEEEKSVGEGITNLYGNLRFPSASYFLGLPLLFFPKESTPPPLGSGTTVAVVLTVAPSPVAALSRFLSKSMFMT